MTQTKHAVTAAILYPSPVSGLMDAKAVKTAERVYAGMNGRKSFPMQKLLSRIVRTAGIRPLIKRKGTLYQGVIDKWTGLGLRAE